MVKNLKRKYEHHNRHRLLAVDAQDVANVQAQQVETLREFQRDSNDLDSVMALANEGKYGIRYYSSPFDANGKKDEANLCISKSIWF